MICIFKCACRYKAAVIKRVLLLTGVHFHLTGFKAWGQMGHTVEENTLKWTQSLFFVSIYALGFATSESSSAHWGELSQEL